MVIPNDGAQCAGYAEKNDCDSIKVNQHKNKPLSFENSLKILHINKNSLSVSIIVSPAGECQIKFILWTKNSFLPIGLDKPDAVL